MPTMALLVLIRKDMAANKLKALLVLIPTHTLSHIKPSLKSCNAYSGFTGVDTAQWLVPDHRISSIVMPTVALLVLIRQHESFRG